nr:hypothetical protein [Bifidobacterium sp. DSM 109959]
MLAMQTDMPIERIRGLISAGCPTPKLDTRAAIFDADGRILLTHENSGE